jgi:hypothetical protein
MVLKKFSMGITFLERYKNGETRTVYDDIMSLQTGYISQEQRLDILSVLNESCNRVAHNLNIIYKELLAIDYNFNKETEYNWQRPLLRPLPDTEKLLLELDQLVGPNGHVPESIKMFYRVVGACNFTWDYHTKEDIPWEGADPIQIIPLGDLLSELRAFEPHPDIAEDVPLDSLDLCADYLHKDNISGAGPYGIEITGSPSIDALFLYEEHETTFIDYLRITFENCGFSRGQEIDDPEFVQFVEKVKPQLLPI